MLEISSIVREGSDISSHDKFSLNMKTLCFVTMDGEKFDRFLLKPMGSVYVCIHPYPAFSGIVSVVSMPLSFRDKGLTFQDMRLVDIQESEYPDMIRCFVSNLSNCAIELSTEFSYLYQWFHTVEYL